MNVEVAKAGEVANGLAQMAKQSLRIDILVNNAGYLGRYKPFAQFEASEWQHILQVNLVGVFEVTRQILPLMRHAGRGRNFNLGSLAGKEGPTKLRALSAAKSGLNGFKK